MEHGNKLKIGEFSKLCRVSVRALRHYEEIGLLVPEIIDYGTGYRYYDVSQMQKMNNISRLKNLGFSLAEISDLYEEDTHHPDIEALESKIRQTEKELEMLRLRLTLLAETKDSRKAIEKMQKIYFDELPEIKVATYKARIASYDDLGMLCYGTIGPEMAKAGCVCAEPGYCFTVENGEHRSSDLDLEYCEQVVEILPDTDTISFKTLPHVPKALCIICKGPYSRLEECYRTLIAEIDSRGYKVAGQARTAYLEGAWDQENPEEWLSVIQIPVVTE
ncbi:MAG: MerR family transcriptional regulator [Candidatus Cryptobacteroides sp.]